MMPLSTIKKLVFAAALSLATFGCGSTDGPTAEEQKKLDEARELFNSGKAYLEAGEYELARGNFKRLIAETEDPDDVEYVALLNKWDKTKLLSKSRFSFVMADILYQVNNAVSQLGDILGLLGDTGVLGGSPSVVLTPAGRIAHFQQLAEQYAPAAGGIDSTIDSLLDNIRAPFAVWIAQLEKVKEAGEFSIEYDELPVNIGDTTVMKMPGEYDMGEVYFILSLASFVAGALDGIMALDMAVDLGSALKDIIPFVAYQQERSASFLDFDGNTFVKDVMDLVAVVFYLNPSFLSVGDATLVTRGADETADAFKYLAAMFEEVRRDAKSGDPQDNDIVGYFKNAEEDLEYIELHFDLVLAVPIDGVDVTKLENLQVELNEEFLNALDNVENAYRGAGTARVEWGRDIVPMISLAAVTILRTGMLDQLIADAAGEQVNELLGSGFLTPDVIGGVLTSVIPDVFRFNVGAIRETGGCGLRCILPLWTIPQDGYNKNSVIKRDNGDDTFDIVFHPFSEISFIYEYECFVGTTDVRRDPLLDGTYICGENDARDIRHFEDVTGQTFTYYSEDLSTYTREEPANNQISAAADVSFVTEYVFDRQAFQDYHEVYVPKAVRESPAISAKDYESVTSAVWGINADGIDSRLPYIAFQDASLGRLIEFNFSNANLTDESLKAMDDMNTVDVWTDGSTPKGQLSRAMNGLIAKVAENVVSFIPSGE